MKKLIIIILIIGTILLSGCGINQNQVSSENKSLSQEKVVVSSGEKVKNSMKDKSKIKKVILKLKPEHYSFGEERYLYEVWINGKGI